MKFILLIVLLIPLYSLCQDDLDSALARDALKEDTSKLYKITPIVRLGTFIAKPDSKYTWILKLIPIPGKEYHLIKADSISNKYWMSDNSGSPLKTASFYSEDNSIKLEDLYRFFWRRNEAESIKKKYGLKIWNIILEGEVLIGWNKEQCRLSWGEPKDINKTINAHGISEQWVYGSAYLYFENGKLTTIQN